MLNFLKREWSYIVEKKKRLFQNSCILINPISDEPSGRDLVNLSVEIAEKIREIKEINNVEKINLYIDANGGFRDFIQM